MKYITETTTIILRPETEPIYSDQATEIQIIDEGAGRFVEVSQTSSGCGKIGIDPEEWEHLKTAIDKMIEACKVV